MVDPLLGSKNLGGKGVDNFTVMYCKEMYSTHCQV